MASTISTSGFRTVFVSQVGDLVNDRHGERHAANAAEVGAVNLYRDAIVEHD